MAALRDDGYQPSVKLVSQRAFAKLVSDCKNPPEPSKALIEMFASRKAVSNKA